MSKYIAILLLAISAFYVADAMYDVDGPVKVLDDTNFEDFINSNAVAFVEFYAPWCGHCKNLKPTWIEAAQKAKDDGKDFVFAAYDADAHKKYGGKYGVRGFPTIKVFRNGQAEDYNGGRTVKDFFAEGEKTSLHKLSSKDEVETFLKRANAVVGCFDDDALLDKYTTQANSLGWSTPMGVVGGDVGKEAGLNVNEVVGHVLGEDKQVFSGDIDSSAFADFVKSITPLLEELNQELYKNYVMEGEVGSFLAFLNYDADTHDASIATMTALAKKFRGKANFFYLDGVQFGRFAKGLGLDENNLPQIGVLQPKVEKQFAHKGDFSEDAISQFVDDFLADKLVRVYRSEPEPEQNEAETGMFVAVGSTFDDQVVNYEKDTFIEFYAPWCGHCKKLAPIYDQLAEKYKDDANMRIAKMDLDANEIDGKYGVKGFPTLKFFKGGNPEPVDYEGDRTLDAMAAFIEKNRS